MCCVCCGSGQAVNLQNITSCQAILHGSLVEITERTKLSMKLNKAFSSWIHLGIPCRKAIFLSLPFLILEEILISTDPMTYASYGYLLALMKHYFGQQCSVFLQPTRYQCLLCILDNKYASFLHHANLTKTKLAHSSIDRQ